MRVNMNETTSDKELTYFALEEMLIAVWGSSRIPSKITWRL